MEVSNNQNQLRPDLLFEFLERKPIYIYTHPNNRYITARNLLAIGSSIFKSTLLVRKFRTLGKIIKAKTVESEIEKITTFTFNSLMDHVAIIACFENYMKGILILKEHLAHEMESEFRQLKNDQYKRPIKLQELIHIPNEKIITNHSVGINTMLTKQAYQNVINLPPEVLKILLPMVKLRNKVHFTNNVQFKVGEETISELKILIDFVNKKIKPIIDSIDVHLEKVRNELEK